MLLNVSNIQTLDNLKCSVITLIRQLHITVSNLHHQSPCSGHPGHVMSGEGEAEVEGERV